MYGDEGLKLAREARRANAAAAAAAAVTALPVVMASNTGPNSNSSSTGGSSSSVTVTSSVGLGAYNEETVRNVVKEIKELFELTRALLLRGEKSDVRLVLYHAAMQRNKRCLVAYLMQRVQAIQNMCWELGTLPPPAIRSLMSKPEVDFLRAYNSLATDYKARYLDLDLLASSLPPKELFVEVRVVHDCGTIQTEQGAIHLRKNSQHFVRRTDVEHLVKQGFLIHLD